MKKKLLSFLISLSMVFPLISPACVNVVTAAPVVTAEAAAATSETAETGTDKATTTATLTVTKPTISESGELEIPTQGLDVLPDDGSVDSVDEIIAGAAKDIAVYNPVDGVADEGITTIQWPEVRDQSPYGTCWAHSAMALSEISMIKNGLADGTVNLSELLMSWFAFFIPEDPLGNAVGDYGYTSFNESRSLYGEVIDDDKKSFLQNGGSVTIAAELLANWSGPFSERLDNAEYGSVSENNAGTGNSEIRRLNGFTDEELKAFSQSSSAARLKNAYVLSPSDADKTDAIKQLVYENGAVSVSYWDEYDEDAEEYKYLTVDTIIEGESDGKKDCYYTGLSGKGSNHAVTIVGWDDNFSKDNFNSPSNAKPENNGAFLIRNSWGSDDEELYSYSKYFWMSYEEPSISTLYSYNIDSKDNYDNNYYYDGSPYSNYINYNGSQENAFVGANVFEAKANDYGEYIKAVAFETANTNLNYNIKLYRNPQTENPASGELLAEKSGRTTFQGIYTVDLDEDIYIEKGDKFSVVVGFEKAGDTVRFVVESNGENSFNYTAAAKEGESFISPDGEDWADATSQGYANLRIKAFTEDVEAEEEEEEVEKIANITFDANGGTISKLDKYAIDSKSTADGKYISQTFAYYTQEDGKIVASVYARDNIMPEREGYRFEGWVNSIDGSFFSWDVGFKDKKHRYYLAKWSKDVGKYPSKDLTYGENGFEYDIDSNGISFSVKIPKADFADIKVADDEVLKIFYSVGSTIPITRNNDYFEDGYYSVWNAVTVDKNEDAIIGEKIFDSVPAGEVEIHLILQYVLVNKDTKNNPNSYIYSDWSNVVGYGQKFGRSVYKDFAQSIGDGVIEEDTSYDNVPGFERIDLNSVSVEISNIKVQTYSGEYLKPAVSVSVKQDNKKVTLTEGKDYIKSYSNNKNAGTATVTVTGSGLYIGTYSKNFTIKPKSTKTLKATSNTVMVGDSNSVISDSITVFDGTKVLKAGDDYQLVLANTSTAVKGKTYAIVKGLEAGNYSTDELKVTVNVIDAFENAEEYIIRKVELAEGVADSLIYKGSAYKASEISVIVSTAKGQVPSTDYTVSVKNTKDVGTGYLTVKAKGKNYKGSVTIPVEIKAPAANSIALSFSTDALKAVNYSGKLIKPAIAVKGSLNGGAAVKLKLNRDYRLIYENNLNATSDSSKARVRVEGIGNYQNAAGISKEFEIKPISIGKATVKGSRQSGLTLTYNKHNLVENVDYKLEWQEENATATKIPVVITGLRNFTLGNPVTKNVKIK